MRVVVSLTTIPGREHLVERSIASLRRQTWQPNAIYLWLPEERFGRTGERFRFAGVDVRSGPDLGPAMKVLPTLSVETDPDTVLISVDDDVEYPPQLVDKLVRSSALTPGHAIGFTGWSVDTGAPDVTDVRHMNEACASSSFFQPVQVIEGTRGILYRRNFFDADIFRHCRALPAFRFHDDILLSGYLASRGIPRTVRWYNCLPRKDASYWKVACQDSGLHTTPDWRQLGWECWSYWSERSGGFPPPISMLSRRARLQLGAKTSPQEGFTLHGLEPASTASDLTHDLHQRPWPWSDGSFHEILALDLFDSDSLDADASLAECARILAPGGAMKFRLPMSPEIVSLANSHSELSLDAGSFLRLVCKRTTTEGTSRGFNNAWFSGLRISLEREEKRIAGTLIKSPAVPDIR